MLKRALRAARKQCSVLIDATRASSATRKIGVAVTNDDPLHPHNVRPTNPSIVPATSPKPKQCFKATRAALAVVEIVDHIASFLDAHDLLAFSRTHSFAFHAIAPRIWRRLPSLQPLVNLLPPDLDGLEDNLPKRWTFYTRQVNEITFDECDARNQFPIPWTIFQHMANCKILLPTLESVIWRCNTARCATALLYFVNDDTLRQLDIGLSDYFSVDIPEARNVLAALTERNLRLVSCKLRMLEDTPLEHPVGDGLMHAVVKFLSSITTVRDLALSPSLLSQDVFEALAQLSNISSFTIVGRDQSRSWPATITQVERPEEASRLPFHSLASVETLHVGIATCNAMLQRSQLQVLSNIKVWTTHLPQPQALVDFIGAVGLLPQLKSLSLSVSAAIPLEHDRREFALPAAALQPLFACTRMTALELFLACPTILHADDAMRMARAWPRLRLLRLAGAGCENIGFRSRLTFSTLLDFSETCPDLRVLQLDVNADLTGIDVEQLHHCSAQVMAKRCRLDHLDVGWSWWAPHGPSTEELTDALLDIFPHGYMELKWDMQLPKHILKRWRDVRESVNMYQ
ncbi:hypothetical protein BKA62DRAFT_711192 [Auriculariales sp. MPI-PUGE-AT-0066]|nr:hypothetical protein BKA62DRAFT_711192 [Auriculariales sp. MPI-PUGE-AT-0066]